MRSADVLGPDYDPNAPVVYDPAVDGDAADANPEATRVLADHIAALMEMVTVMCSVHEGTTTSIATVYLPNGYALATETSTCNDVDAFDPRVGKAIARKRALMRAENKLWELEGYRMMCMNMAAAFDKVRSEQQSDLE